MWTAIVLLSAGISAAAQATQTSAVPAEQAPQPATSSQVMHILVGHSVVVQTQERLRRIVIGNPAVIATVTTAPNEVVVSAKEAGSSSLILRQENGDIRLLEVFSDVDVGPLREAIAQTFPRDHLQVEAQEGKVVLTGTASSTAEAEQVAKMAAPFSKDLVNSLQILPLTRQKQILLKVRFAEVDRAKLTQLGLNLFSTGAGRTVGTVTTGQFGTFGQQLINDTFGVTAAPKPDITQPTAGPSTDTFGVHQTINDVLNLFLFNPDIHLGAVIKALQQRNVLEILAEPNLMAMSGESAKFLAGGEFPYPVVSAGVGAVPTISIQFRPYGVKLDFTGTIEGDNTIRLKVAPEVSSLDYTNTVTISGFVMPAISTRRAETIVELKDGQSFGIAGLLDQRTTAQLSKVPGIGDLPILGQLFRSRSTNKTATELLVLVTPTIVDPLTAPAAAPSLPQMPIPPLSPPEFDKGLPNGQKGKR